LFVYYNIVYIIKSANILFLLLQFTVTKVTDSEQRRNAPVTSRVSIFDTIDENSETVRSNGLPVTPTDTLTSNSITALLSNKWRVNNILLS
jgi:hypothetical protein